jgi:hypothetical protein
LISDKNNSKGNEGVLVQSCNRFFANIDLV